MECLRIYQLTAFHLKQCCILECCNLVSDNEYLSNYMFTLHLKSFPFKQFMISVALLYLIGGNGSPRMMCLTSTAEDFCIFMQKGENFQIWIFYKFLIFDCIFLHHGWVDLEILCKVEHAKCLLLFKFNYYLLNIYNKL